jgi:hypothetical protein
MVCGGRKKWSSVVASRGVAKGRNEKKEIKKGRCPLCLGEKDINQILLDSLETRDWGIKFLNKKLLSKNKEIRCRKKLRCTNTDQIRNVGKCVEKVKYRWFNKTQEV